MKKILLAILAITFASSLCFAAQQSTTPANKTVSTPVIVKTFKGKVELVSLGDPVKKTRSEILVVDNQGKKMSLVVRSSTEILSKDGKVTTLAKLAKGDKVTIEYTTGTTGANRAKSIKVVE